MQISLYFLIHFSTSIFLFNLFFRTLEKKDMHVAKELSFVLLCSAIALFGTALSMVFVNEDFKFFWHEFKFLGVAFMPVSSLFLFLRFFNKNEIITKRNVTLLCLVPVVTIILAWTNNYHHLFRNSLFVLLYDGKTFVGVDSGIWFWIYSAYSYIVLMIAMIILCTGYFRIPIIFRSQTRIMLFGAAIGTAVNVVSVMRLFNDYGDISIAALAFGSICNYWGLCKYKPNKMIELARNLAMNNIKSCVLIFDLNGDLLDANTYAKEEFNISVSDYGKLSSYDFTKNSLKINNTSSLDALEISITRDEVRHYRLTDTPLYDSGGMYIGRVLVLNNITNVKQTVSNLQHIVSHDYLTNLYNNNEFIRQVEIQNKTGTLPISVIYINIDKMRIINSIFSFDYGDKVIKAVANAILSAVSPNKLCFRINGDEFAVMLPSTDAIQARGITNKILEIYQNSADIDISISLSYYIGTKYDQSENLQTVLNDTIQGTHNNKTASNNRSSKEIYKALNSYFVKNEYKTEGHVERLTNLCSALALQLNLDKEQSENLQLLCSVYDIGIISTSKQLIKKIGNLSNDEWEEMKLHTIKGYSIALLSPDINKVSAEILSHHERYDGFGYPNRLSGDSIPLLSRILSLIIYYDNLIYKKSMSPADALAKIKKYSGSRFDPAIVHEFCNVINAQKPEVNVNQDFMTFIQSQLGV